MMLDFVSEVTKYLLILTLSLVICVVIFKWFQTRNYPPGPIGLPVIGYGAFLGKKPNITLTQLGRKYGPIYSFYTGPQLYIIINDYHLAREMLHHPMTLSRPPKAFEFMRGCGGFSGKNGEEWQEQRRFSVMAMRNLGLGKGLWETMIHEDAVYFLEEIRSWNGKPYVLERHLQTSLAINNIALLFGRHLDKNKDKDDIKLITTSTRFLMQYFSAVNVNMALPWLAKIFQFFNLFGYKNFIILLQKFEAVFSRELEARMKDKDSLAKEDFIGTYLREMEKRENDKKPHYFNVDNLLGNLFLLFIAGLDGNIGSISWVLLLVAKHPDVQKKIHDEIDSVFGRDGLIYFDDRNKLPYTMAAILEMHRWASVAPIYPPRYPLESFEFHGYTIPEGSNIVCNAWGIMHDPKYFKNPMEFQPDRFLSSDQTKAAREDGYLPFSTGKRNCPGEGVAMMTTFLYCTSILQKFKVTPKPGGDVDLDWNFSAALLPKPQELCFIER